MLQIGHKRKVPDPMGKFWQIVAARKVPRAATGTLAPKHDFRELFQADRIVQFCFSKISPLQK
jgi:hypothetical protein